MSARWPILVVLAVAAAAGGAFAGGVAGGGGADARGGLGRVVKVVDGDTIHVQLGTARERVRYIGVDTPVLWSRDVIHSTSAGAQRR